MKLEWSKNEDGDHVAEHYYGDDCLIDITVSKSEIKLEDGSLTVTVDAHEGEAGDKRIVELWLPDFIAFAKGLNEPARKAWDEQRPRTVCKPAAGCDANGSTVE
jgi:hypothetical protein